MSRIGNKPIKLPEKVKVAISGSTVHIEGPRGKASQKLPAGIAARLENNTVIFKNESDTRESKALHGLARSLVNNHILGVHAGFKKKLEIQGVGFKAALQGAELALNLGYSHQIKYKIPAGIKVTVEENVNITIEGSDKQLVGAVAADIRRYYPPEPYKGKGVRYSGEQILRKEGKTAQGK
jgi:large subunit ribosomal protein L6